MKKFILLLSLLMTHSSMSKASNITGQSLDGTYDMQLIINGHTFNDILVLEGEQSPIKMHDFYGPLKGSITVVDSFTSPLTGLGTCSTLASMCDFTFDIVAHENGQDFNVHYIGRIDNPDYLNILDGLIPPRITGSAYLDNNVLLGHYIAIKRK